MAVRHDGPSANRDGNRLQRRTLLRAWGIGAGGLAATGLLAACGSTASAPTPGGTTSPPTMTTALVASPTTSGGVAVAPSTASAKASGSVTASAAAGGGGQVSIFFSKPVTLQPIFSNTGSDQNTERAIFGTLVKMTDKLEPVPDLAEKVEVSTDAKIYTFTLRGGLRFTDGQPLTAKDVAFTIERAVDKRTGSFWRGRFLDIAGAAEFDEGKAQTISGLETPDDRTVRVTLKAPDAAFLVTLGDYSGLGILPAHLYKDVAPDQMQKHPSSLSPTVSAGPFQFVQYATDQYLELKRNETYGGPKAKLDRIFLKILTIDAAIAELERGELDVLGGVPSSEVARLKKSAQVEIVSVPSPSITRIAINNEKEYLKDKRVRQALMYAIDRASIVKELLNGEAQVINTPILGPEWMGEILGLNEYAYNPDKARQLLKEANWDSGRRLQFILTPNDATAKTFAPIVQQQLQDAGMQIELLQLEGAEATSRYLQKGDFELYTFGGGVFRADPDNAAKFFATRNIAPAGANGFRYSNPQVDSLFEQGKAVTDQAKRKEAYLQVAKILNDEIPMVYLWSPNSIFAYNKRLQGFKPPSYAGNTLWNAEEWSVTK